MTMDLNTVNTVSIIVIGVLVLLAILAAAIFSKIITKLIAVVIVLGLAVAVYWQRDELTGCVQDCQCTFFGQEVEIPQNDLVNCPS
jgi:hypothetical protein